MRSSIAEAELIRGPIPARLLISALRAGYAFDGRADEGRWGALAVQTAILSGFGSIMAPKTKTRWRELIDDPADPPKLTTWS
jgi:hypothetical protein